MDRRWRRSFASAPRGDLAPEEAGVGAWEEDHEGIRLQAIRRGVGRGRRAHVAAISSLGCLKAGGHFRPFSPARPVNATGITALSPPHFLSQLRPPEYSPSPNCIDPRPTHRAPRAGKLETVGQLLDNLVAPRRVLFQESKTSMPNRTF